MTAAYISPMRYTLIRREPMIIFTGMGIDSRKSLSLAMYRLE